MQKSMLKFAALMSALLLATSGCGEENGGEENQNQTNQNQTENQTTNNQTNQNQGQDDGWTLYEHPCAGNRTDALHCDDAQTCFVGCGTTTTGNQGMYQTTDGGATWARPTTNPANVLDTARVNDISRSADGLLYIAGEITGPTRVISMDDAGNLEIVWDAGTHIDFSFTAGSFRRAANGWAIAESLTGVGLVYREGDSAEWETGYGFWSDGDDDDDSFGIQILALQDHGDEIFGVGSTISQPPTVLLPKWTAGDFDFHIVQLAASGLGAFNGELWGIDVDDDGIVAGGVNQAANTGVIFTHAPGDGDATEPGNWSMFNVGTLFPDQTTWVQGVCRGNGTIYAVGRESSEEWGFVLRSTDGGATFEDISPYDDGATESNLSDAYRCQVTGDGVIVAGAGGQFAVFAE